MNKVLIQIVFLLLMTSQLFSQDGLTAEVTNATKENNCDNGSIDLSISGGIPPYDVAWSFQFSNPIIPQIFNFPVVSGIQGDNDGEDIDAPALVGNYTVIVTDALCGTAEASFVIECECLECELAGDVFNSEGCGDNGFGAIAVSLSCESEISLGDYYFAWSDLDPMYLIQPTSRSSLSPGEYCLTVTSKVDESCSYSQCWIVENDTGNLKPTLVSKSNIPECRSGANTCVGALEIDVPVGAEITWEGVGNSQINNASISGLCAGTYTVTVELNGCIATSSFEIECCSTLANGDDEIDTTIRPIFIDGRVTQITDGECTGGIILTGVTFDPSDLVITWSASNGSTNPQGAQLSNLCPGTYCASVYNGCSTEEFCYTIHDCDSIGDNFELIVDHTCQGYSKGKATLVTDSDDFEIVWSTGATGKKITILAIGTYSVTVSTDKCSQETVLNFNITDEKELFCIETETDSEFACNQVCYCNGKVSESRVFSDFGIVEHGGNWCRNTLYCGDKQVGVGGKVGTNTFFSWELGLEIDPYEPCQEYKKCPLDQSYWPSGVAEKEYKRISVSRACYKCKKGALNWVTIPEPESRCIDACLLCPPITSDPPTPTSITSCKDDSQIVEYIVSGEINDNFSYIRRYDGELNLGSNNFLNGSSVIKAIKANNCSTIIAGNFSSETIEDESEFEQAELIGGKDIFIFNESTDGEMLWSCFFGTEDDDFITDIFVDENNNISVLGHSSAELTVQDQLILSSGGTFILQLDSNGVLQSHQSITSSSVVPEIYKLIKTKENNFIITGIFQDDLFINNQLQASASEGYTSDGFIAYFSDENSVEWIKTISAESIHTELISEDISSNSIYSLVSYSGNLSSVEIGINSSSESLDKAILLTKITNSGEIIWSIMEGSEGGSIEIKDIEVFENGNILLGGYIEGSITFSNGDIYVSNGKTDVLFIEFNKDGNIVSIDTEGTESEEYFADMLVENDSIVYVGHFKGSSTTIENLNFDGEDGLHNHFIVKRHINENVGSRRNSDVMIRNDVSSKNKLFVSPNPFSTIINVNTNGEKVSRVEVYNSIGVLLLTKNTIDDLSFDLDLGLMDSGVLFLKFYDKSNSMLEIQRVVKIR